LINKIHHTSVRLWGNLRVRQVALLYAANLAGIPLALVTSIIFTRFLGPRAYGDFAFLDLIFDFGKIIFSLGFFYAGSRAIVLSNDPKKTREYYGATLLILFLLFGLMACFMMAYGLIDSNLQEKGLTNFFLLLIPFSWIFLLIPFFDTTLKADNRVNALAATRFLPKVFLFLAALVVYYLLANYGGNRLAVVWSLYLTVFFLVFFIILVRIRVSFSNIKPRMKEIWQYNKGFGVHIYTGGLFYAGSLSLTGILISYFSPDNTGVGFLALALAISRPLELVPNAIATAYFKDFSTQSALSVRLLILTSLLSLGVLLFTWLLIGPFIRIFYSEDFLPVINLVYPISAAMLMHGMAGLLNRYLEARGKGKYIRNTYMVTGLTLLVANLLLIPGMAETGAALAMVFSGIVYLSVMSAYYKNR
jgi:O-antigen/teichoic acid export membrane protein